MWRNRKGKSGGGGYSYCARKNWVSHIIGGVKKKKKRRRLEPDMCCVIFLMNLQQLLSLCVPRLIARKCSDCLYCSAEVLLLYYHTHQELILRNKGVTALFVILRPTSFDIMGIWVFFKTVNGGGWGQQHGSGNLVSLFFVLDLHIIQSTREEGVCYASPPPFQLLWWHTVSESRDYFICCCF